MSGRVLFFVSCLVLAHGCNASDLHTTRTCQSDRDCPSARPHCAGITVADRPAIVVPCKLECATEADCGQGFYCSNLENQRCPECLEKCQTAGCTEGYVCAEAGDCQFTSCDDSGAPACPDGWRCDPTAATTNDVGAHADPNDNTRIARGCARNPCGEENGAYCADLWRCDPTTSTVSSGCVPLPCADTGHCSNDALFICTPTNTGPRESGVDAHGCVHRNCSEGPSVCTADQVCDGGSCRPRTCAERECPAGSTCTEVDAGFSTCSLPPPSAGGASGAGGASNTAGSTSRGGASAAGSWSRSPGHCE